MRKGFILSLTIAVLIMSANVVGAIQTAGQLSSPMVGRVVEIIDADAIAVRLVNGQLAYVKLLGIDASTKQGGLKFMQDVAFGRMVTVVPDYTGSAPSMSGRFSYGYVFFSPEATTSIYGNDMLNQLLVKYGYAEVDNNYRDISSYATLVNAQNQAKSQKAGIWGEGQKPGSYLISDKININTADRATLEYYMNYLTSDSIVSNILSYRNYNPFENVRELKFVKGMTKEIYDNNKYIFSVITNINKATEKELRSLKDATASTADSIIKYRMSKQFTTLTELYTDANVDRSFYDLNRYYMAVNDSTVVNYAIPNAAVNINTATQSQLSAISAVSQSLASKIVEGRRYGYTYKTLMELRNIHNLTVQEVHELADNLHVYTDINTATTGELESLFGIAQIPRDITNIVSLRTISDITRLRSVLEEDRYNKIKDHIYAGTLQTPERININTATEPELRGIGMSATEASRILALSGRITSPTHIPFDISKYDKMISLYTDINTATPKELRSLNVFTENNIAEIIRYRDDQPFGSDEEVSKFCEDLRVLSAYNKVRGFIVVR